MKKLVKVTETVYLEKIIEVSLKDANEDIEIIEDRARIKAFDHLPDYKGAGWTLINSDGCEFTVLKETP